MSKVSIRCKEILLMEVDDLAASEKNTKDVLAHINKLSDYDVIVNFGFQPLFSFSIKICII